MKTLYEREYDGIKFTIEAVSYGNVKKYHAKTTVGNVPYDLIFEQDAKHQWQLNPQSPELPDEIGQYSSRLVQSIKENEQ